MGPKNAESALKRESGKSESCDSQCCVRVEKVGCDSGMGRISSRHPLSRAAKRGCFKRGGFPDLDLSFLFLSFFVLFCPFPGFSGIFPICSGMVRGFSRFVPFLFLGLLSAPTRNSPERVRDTIGTFPKKKVGNTRVWKLSVPKKSQSQKNRCVFKSQSTKSQVLPQKSQRNRQKKSQKNR